MKFHALIVSVLLFASGCSVLEPLQERLNVFLVSFSFSGVGIGIGARLSRSPADRRKG